MIGLFVWWDLANGTQRIAHCYQVLRNFVGIQNGTKNAHFQSILLLTFKIFNDILEKKFVSNISSYLNKCIEFIYAIV